MAANNNTTGQSLGQSWSSLLSQLEEMRDPRCDNWWMMSSLWPTVLLSTSYYIFVRHAGPRLMNNRSDLSSLLQTASLPPPYKSKI